MELVEKQDSQIPSAQTTSALMNSRQVIIKHTMTGLKFYEGNTDNSVLSITRYYRHKAYLSKIEINKVYIYLVYIYLALSSNLLLRQPSFTK